MKREVVRNDHSLDALVRRVLDLVEVDFPNPDQNLIRATVCATLKAQRDFRP
jgi:hypothetical protein